MDLTGYRLVFDEEFSGNSLDTTKWTEKSSALSDGQQGNLTNQQLEWNSFRNVWVADGVLTIEARREAFTSASGTQYSWTSGFLTSKFQFQYGYMEERAKLPAAKGFWPALWTWQIPGFMGPGTQEIDAYEFYSDNHTRLYLTSHVGSGGSFVYEPPFDPSADFHTYGLDIRPDGTTWYVDGKAVFSAPSTLTSKVNILSNLAVYSRIPPDPGTMSARKLVDYIRVYSKDPSLPTVQPQPGYDGPGAVMQPPAPEPTPAPEPVPAPEPPPASPAATDPAPKRKKQHPKGKW